MRKVMALVLCLSLAGCSSWATIGTTVVDAFTDSGKDGLTVDTELINGDKQQTVETGKISKTESKMEDVTLKDNAQMTIENKTKTVTKDLEQHIATDKIDELTVNSGITFMQSVIACIITGILCLIAGLFLPQVQIGKIKINED